MSKKNWMSAFAAVAVGGLMVFACGGDDDEDITPGTDASTQNGSSGNVTSSSSGGSSSGGSSSGGSSSGESDAGDSGADECLTCSEAITQGAQLACADNGPPSSLALVNAIFECACTVNGGACATPCERTCTAIEQPSQECLGCVQSECPAELGACVADGQPAGDGGTEEDAGDGG